VVFAGVEICCGQREAEWVKSIGHVDKDRDSASRRHISGR